MEKKSSVNSVKKKKNSLWNPNTQDFHMPVTPVFSMVWVGLVGVKTNPNHNPQRAIFPEH